ncbi:MAG: hypothetical protein ACREXY_26325, partial [Gammaproteobacteria bacterium]
MQPLGYLPKIEQWWSWHAPHIPTPIPWASGSVYRSVRIATSGQTSEAIVLVHGLYMHSDWGMAVLRYRLASMGFAAFRFSYPSVAAS